MCELCERVSGSSRSDVTAGGLSALSDAQSLLPLAVLHHAVLGLCCKTASYVAVLLCIELQAYFTSLPLLPVTAPRC